MKCKKEQIEHELFHSSYMWHTHTLTYTHSYRGKSLFCTYSWTHSNFNWPESGRKNHPIRRNHRCTDIRFVLVSLPFQISKWENPLPSHSYVYRSNTVFLPLTWTFHSVCSVCKCICIQTKSSTVEQCYTICFRHRPISNIDIARFRRAKKRGFGLFHRLPSGFRMLIAKSNHEHNQKIKVTSSKFK